MIIDKFTKKDLEKEREAFEKELDNEKKKPFGLGQNLEKADLKFRFM